MRARRTKPVKQTILIVEDEPVTRQRLRAVLEEAGYAVAEAHNGREAVNYLVACQAPASTNCRGLSLGCSDGFMGGAWSGKPRR